jgi:hypothetical protein
LFGTSDAERIRIDSSGRVGIGTTPSGNAKLQVTSQTTSEEGIKITTLGTGNDFYALKIGTGTSADTFAVTNAGNVGIGTSSPQASGGYGVLQLNGSTGGVVKFSDDDTLVSQIYGSDASLNVQTEGTRSVVIRTNGAERVRITGGGYLKASNTGLYDNVNSPNHELRNNAADTTLVVQNTNASGDGIISIVNANDTARYFYRGYSTASEADNVFIYSNGNIVNRNNSYGPLSDIKLKENITDASPKLDKLMEVRIVNYNLIGDELNQIGVIAQELEQVFPSLVDEHSDTKREQIVDEDGNVTTQEVDLGTTTKSVKMSVFVPIMIKAMQEQQEIINDLKARIETLENK